MNTQELLEVLANNAYLVYSDTLANGRLHDRFDELKNPKVGDIVMEITTHFRKGTAFNRIGVLKEITYEPFDPNNEDGPGGTVYYIERMDGTVFRWHNADFIKILQDNPEWRQRG